MAPTVSGLDQPMDTPTSINVGPRLCSRRYVETKTMSRRAASELGASVHARSPERRPGTSHRLLMLRPTRATAGPSSLALTSGSAAYKSPRASFSSAYVTYLEDREK